MVRSAGIPELVCSTPQEYIDRAIMLAEDEQRLREAEEMRKELQAINPIASQGGGAMVIRNLQQSSRKLQEKEEEIARIRAEQDEQMARFKAQVAATVQREASLSGASLAATAKAPAKRSDFAPRTAV